MFECLVHSSAHSRVPLPHSHALLVHSTRALVKSHSYTFWQACPALPPMPCSLLHFELHHLHHSHPLRTAFIQRKPVSTALFGDICLPTHLPNTASLPRFELHHLHHSHPLRTAFIQTKPVSTALFGDSCLPTHLPNTASLPRFELHHLHPSHPLRTAFIQGKPVSTASPPQHSVIATFRAASPASFTSASHCLHPRKAGFYRIIR